MVLNGGTIGLGREYEIGLGGTYEAAGGVDSCAAGCGAVHPFWTLEAPESIFGHGRWGGRMWWGCGLYSSDSGLVKCWALD